MRHGLEQNIEEMGILVNGVGSNSILWRHTPATSEGDLFRDRMRTNVRLQSRERGHINARDEVPNPNKLSPYPSQRYSLNC